MKKLILTAVLIMPSLGFGQAYKCTVDGVTKYQAAPCQADGKALELKTPSPELLAKMQDQEKGRDQYWAGLQKAEAEKVKAENAERAERERVAYARELERERQVINARSDQSWQDYRQDRQDYACQKAAAQGHQGQGCQR